MPQRVIPADAGIQSPARDGCFLAWMPACAGMTSLAVALIASLGIGPPMTDVPPDRLSVDPASPFHDPAVLARGVGVRFRGVERRDVEEYCVSENWIRAAAGKALDRKGAPLIIKMTGPVEPYFLAPAASATDGN
jgi:hypothetical protein